MSASEKEQPVIIMTCFQIAIKIHEADKNWLSASKIGLIKKCP